MFLPVLLIRDYGHWAWWVFAIPNIVGAAAMGWVMRSPAHSIEYVQNHRAAVRVFSVVTVAFQLFFAVWMIQQLAGLAGVYTFLVLSAACLLLAGGRLGPVMCGVTLVASVVAWFSASDHLAYPPRVPPSLNIVWLSLSCIAGFLACPYLDITFHRARQLCPTPAQSRWAFGLGFGLFFGSMILFTLLYASQLGSSAALAKWVGLHMAVQAALTFGLHARGELELARGGYPGHILRALALVAAVVLGHPATAHFLHLPPGETTYRLFMGFYGLVFPAYVIIHLRAGGRKHWWLLLATLAVAGPMFYAAFIMGYMVWLLPGTATLLVAYVAADVIRQKLPRPRPPAPQ
jgi:hypothetical protein